MNEDRIAGAGHRPRGAIKEAAGKVAGDIKMRGEGPIEKATGKVQNTVGGAKDTVRQATKH